MLGADKNLNGRQAFRILRLSLVPFACVVYSVVAHATVDFVVLWLGRICVAEQQAD